MLAIYVVPAKAYSELFGVWAVVLILLTVLTGYVVSGLGMLPPVMRRRAQRQILALLGGVVAAVSMLAVYSGYDNLWWCWCWW